MSRRGWAAMVAIWGGDSGGTWAAEAAQGSCSNDDVGVIGARGDSGGRGAGTRL